MSYTLKGLAISRLSLVFSYKEITIDDFATQKIEVRMFGDKVPKLDKYMTKGSRHHFTLSHIHIKEYRLKDGSTRVKLVGVVDDVQLGVPNE